MYETLNYPIDLISKCLSDINMNKQHKFMNLMYGLEYILSKNINNEIAKTYYSKKDSEIIDEIESECNRNDGRPETKNPFQISACPWCGTKLISEGDYGFSVEKKLFKIRCLNNRCTFHKGIPVQVVDEMLFRQPPTQPKTA